MDIISIARAEPALTDEQKEEIRRWLKTVLTTKSLSDLAEKLVSSRKREQARRPDRGQSVTMFDLAMPFMARSLDLAFRDDEGNAWSERFGRAMTRNDFTNHIDPELLGAVKVAGNYPLPTLSDPTKPIVHIQRELKVVWTALTGSLSDEVHAERLGPDSKAAEMFRLKVIRLWLTPETWMKFEGKGTAPGHVERMSLASRVRELTYEAGRRPPRWDRVLKGVNAFYRVERDEDDELVAWLAMRADLCRGEIKGVSIDNVHNQTDLTTLMNRYGLADTGTVADRIRDGGKRHRLCVLSRELCDYLIDCVDPEPKQGGPVEDDHDGPVDSEKVAFDPETGEVLCR
jgi:hypothetical protein